MEKPTWFTDEQYAICEKNRLKARKRLNVPKGYQLHHIDENLRYTDIDRYILWLDEDLVIMSNAEHCKHHHKGQTPWNKGCTNDSDIRIKRISEKTSETRKRMFKEGLLNVSGENNGMYGKHKEWWSKDGETVFVDSFPGEEWVRGRKYYKRGS